MSWTQYLWTFAAFMVMSYGAVKYVGKDGWRNAVAHAITWSIAWAIISLAVAR